MLDGNLVNVDVIIEDDAEYDVVEVKLFLAAVISRYFVPALKLLIVIG